MLRPIFYVFAVGLVVADLGYEVWQEGGWELLALFAVIGCVIAASVGALLFSPGSIDHHTDYENPD